MASECEAAYSGADLAHTINLLTGIVQGYDSASFDSVGRLRITCLVDGEAKKKRADLIYVNCYPALALTGNSVYFVKDWYNRARSAAAWWRSCTPADTKAPPHLSMYRFSNAHDSIAPEERFGIAAVLAAASVLDVQRAVPGRDSRFKLKTYMDIFEQL